MLTQYRVQLYSPDGATFLADLSGFMRLEYVRTVNQVGALTLTIDSRYLPINLLDNRGMVRRDLRIIVFRQPAGAAMEMDADAIWFVRNIRRTRSRISDVYTIEAVCQNHLLKRRIVAYDAAKAETEKTAPIDNIMKAVVRENFTAATDTTRNISDIQVDADTSEAPSVTKVLARREVLSLLQELAEEAAAQIAALNQYLSFDLVPLGVNNGFMFRTFINQRGVDRRLTFKLGEQYKNIGDMSIEYRTIDEKTRIYAGGEGQKDDRFIVQADNMQSIGASPYNVIEYFNDGSNGETVAAVTTEAYQDLWKQRALTILDAAIIESPSARYGVDYGFGDRVMPEMFGLSFDSRVASVRVAVDNAGETIDARLHSEALT